MFFEGKVIRVLVHFFFTATSLTHFHPALVATSISPFVTTTTKFSCCYSNKKMSPFFYLSLQISAAFFLVERRWPAAYFVFFSGCFSLLLYSKFVDVTINLSLIFQTTRIQEQFLLFFFVFLDSLVVSALKNTSGQVISRFSFGLLYLLIELFYIGMPVVWTTVVWLVYGHVITKFSGIFRVSYPWCSAVCARALLLDGCCVTQVCGTPMDCLVVLKAFSYGVTGMGCNSQKQFNMGAALFYDGKIQGLNFFPCAFIPKETFN